MELLDIPIEVIEAHVLPHLQWNDLLRLRRVSNWTKDIVDGYLKVNPELAPEIEIDEEDKTFAAFLKMGIPTTKVFINNRSGCGFYQDNQEDLLKFIKEFGPFVRSLRVDQITLRPFGAELDLLDGLKNLESIEAGRCGGYPRGIDPDEVPRVLKIRESLRNEDPRTRYHPEFLKRLKKLKIGNNDECIVLDQFEVNNFYLNIGKELTSIALPFDHLAKEDPSTFSQWFGDHFRGQPMAIEFKTLWCNVIGRMSKNPPLPKYEEIDFQNLHNHGSWITQFYNECTASRNFVMLCLTALSHDIKLWNVESGWFMGFQPAIFSPVIGTPVRSLVNLHPCAVSLEMPNLERIEVQSTARSSPGANWRNERLEWPALKTLAINVDSKTGKCQITRDPNETFQRIEFHTTSTKELFGFFFENASRTAMTELKLEFSGDAEKVAIPKMDLITSACPNLKKLALVKWPGLNKALIKLFGGLPGLEEISLEYCKPLGNVAFVGEDVRAPIFLKLGKLRKLSLKGLDQMPKITDLLFSLVIRHAKLTHLILSSDAPMKSITAAGIPSLCDGDFEESIEKFPFKNWSLSDVSAEEFKKLEAMFRSSKML